MTRTVSVKLEADISKYVAGMGAAAAATKGLRDEHSKTSSDLKKSDKLLPSPTDLGRMSDKLALGITKSIPPQLTQAIAAGAVAGSPFLAATLVGAITGGAGLLGIGGGIALAMRDPKIKAEAKALGGFIDEEMRDAFGGFGPAMTESIGIVRNKVADLNDEFERIGDNSADALVPLTESVTEAFGSIVEGLDNVIGESGPTMRVIGEGIEGIGDAVEKFLNMTASNADVGAKALSDLFAIIEFGIGGLTVAVDLLAKAYKWGTAWTTLIPGMDGVGEASEGAANNMGILGKETEESGKKAEVAQHKFVALEDILQKTAERNLSAAEATIAMRKATKDLADAVDKKSGVTDKERTALISYSRTINNATSALDEQGRTVGEATAAHETNRKKLIQTAIRMGFTRAEAKKLADQYIATPKNVNTTIGQPGMPKSREQIRLYNKQQEDLARKINTSINVTGDRVAGGKLDQLLIRQQALKKGINISAAASAYNKNAYYSGGRTAMVGEHEPAGIVHGRETVLSAKATRNIDRQAPGFIDEMLATGQVPGYAAGGRVLNAPFPVNSSITKIMTLADALSKVAPSFGNWPSSPGAQRGDSGVWRKVLQLIRSGPDSGSFGNAYRPGDPKWHGSGRAVDWMGYQQDALATYLAGKRPLELIHRTSRRDYAYTRGVNKGSFSAGLMNAHKNHIHIAMQNGGTIMEPVFGVGRSGATYSFGEGGRPERVTPGGGGGGDGNVFVTVQAGYVVSERDLENKIATTVDRLRARGRA